MAFTVDISEETADRLVVNILTNSLQYLRADIDRLSSRATLLDFEAADLDNFKTLEAQFVGVIRYFTPPSEWDQV